MVVMLKQCCCGCTLKTGTLIIAVVFAILAGLQVTMYSMGAVELSERYDYLRGELAFQEQELTGTSMPSRDEDEGPLGSNDTSHHHSYEHPVPLTLRIKITNIWRWCMILLSITETINFILNILLMFAANKDSARHVLIWLFGFFGTTCSRTLLQIVIDGSIFYVDFVAGGFVLLSVAVVLTVGAAYSLLVVLSYYRQLVGTGIARRISQQDD
ncbi:uncharacterized protein LOC126425258 [Schistocerca serialis cubense]|uniref:uncharacterized protein LOC126425258 n=1 Tax=Schistocerca serialis cubense TaxID=2023355 RepID=UPI00214EF5C2|nr:uncharacterized protein LOC126425258 [Schistocerca serialis cubense]